MYYKAGLFHEFFNHELKSQNISTPNFLLFIPEIESLLPVVKYPFEHVVCLDNLTKDHPKAFVTSAESALNIVTKLPQTLSQKALRSKALLSGRTKVSFFGQCSKMQIIPIKKLNIKTCFIQFLWFFRLKC